MALCTTTQVKAHAGISGTTFDTMIAQMIAQVEDVIEHETGVRTFSGDGNDIAISNELIDGTGLTRLEVKYWPITALTTIETRNSSWGWDTYTQQAVGDMEIDQRNFIHSQYVIGNKGERTIRVTYTCGYETDDVPEDLNLCAILMVLGLFTQRNSVGLSSQVVLGLTLNLSNEDHLFIERTLKKYERTTVL